MMSRVSRSLSFAMLVAHASLLHAQPDTDVLAREAASVAQQFAASLKPELLRAIADGGPAHAIEVCVEIAPHIANNLSVETGWDIRRVSLKTRNPDNATPDDYERAVLEDFDARHAAGENADGLATGSVVGNEYRFLRAQVVEPVCLVCHGRSVAPAIEDALGRYYPDDTARGYDLGDIRGAISVRRQLP